MSRAVVHYCVCGHAFSNHERQRCDQCRCPCFNLRNSARPPKKAPPIFRRLTDDEIVPGVMVVCRRPEFEVDAVEGVDFRTTPRGEHFATPGVSLRWGRTADEGRAAPHGMQDRWRRIHRGVNCPGTIVDVVRGSDGLVIGLGVRREDNGDTFACSFPSTIHLDGRQTRSPGLEIGRSPLTEDVRDRPPFVVRVKAIRGPVML